MKVIYASLIGSAAANASFTKAVEVTQSLTDQTTADIKRTEVELSEETQNHDNDINMFTTKGDRAKAAFEAASRKAEAEKERAETESDKADAEANNRDTAIANLAAMLQTHNLKTDECTATLTKRQEQKERINHALKKLENDVAALNSGASFLQEVNSIMLANGQEPVQASKHTYENQSQKIIEIFEMLQKKISDQFDDEKTNCNNHAQNYKLGKSEQSNLRDNGIKAYNMAKKAQSFAAKASAEAQTEADNQEKSFLAANKNLRAEQTAKEQFVSSTKRAIASLNKQLQGLIAVMNLIETKVGTAAKNHMLVQKVGVSFVQIREPSSQLRISSFLNAKGLSALATKISQSPLDSVKNMIEDLISKLEVEAANESKQHGDCTANKNKVKAELDMINNKLDDNSANREIAISYIQERTMNIKDYTQNIADLEKALSDATNTRNEEKATNAKTTEELNTGVDGLEEIIKLIETEMEEATQKQLKPQFEVIATDMRTTATNVKASEMTAAAAYHEFSKNSNNDLTSNQTLLEEAKSNKSNSLSEKANLEKKIEALGNNKQDQTKYSLIVEKKCNNKLSHGEKIAKMKAEIQSLTEALTILEA